MRWLKGVFLDSFLYSIFITNSSCTQKNACAAYSTYNSFGISMYASQYIKWTFIFIYVACHELWHELLIMNFKLLAKNLQKTVTNKQLLRIFTENQFWILASHSYNSMLHCPRSENLFPLNIFKYFIFVTWWPQNDSLSSRVAIKNSRFKNQLKPMMMRIITS